MDYAFLKLLHQLAVALSAAGFAVRGLASLRGAKWTQGRLAKTLPHVVDTVLLLSAIALAVQLHVNPAYTPWLLAKILGLLAYIGLGMLALRPRLSLRLRSVSWVMALVVLSWMVSVALLKDPWGFWGLVVPARL